jgi:hypothetical protein
MNPADAAELAARAMYNAGGGNYPMPRATAAAPAPAAPGNVAQLAAAPSAPAEPAPAPDPATAAQERAERQYGAPTQGAVDWNEPAAQAADYQLQAPAGVLDMSPVGQDALARLREGFAEAGAGKTLAAELFSDAVRAQQGQSFTVGRASAEADLRREWGGRYDAKVAAAQGLIRRVATRCPEVVGFLERTGLGNDPAFIRKIAAAAARRGR